jgi:Trk K+ transport system NAD-binding subunit
LTLSRGRSTRRRRDLRTDLRYVRRVLREFRWTIAALLVALAVGGVLYRMAPERSLGGAHLTWEQSLYGAWMSLFAQPLYSPPDTWYLGVLAGVYPLLGVFFIGEGLVRFALLMVSRRRGEKEWMLVMASTFRNHVVVCGLGHLGIRVLRELVAQGRQVAAIEKDPNGRFVEEAKETGAAILIRDMKDDEALVQAGVPHAQSIIAATDDDMANLEVALDAKRMNPAIRTAVRLFDPAMASKLRAAFEFDFAFSSSALAAPTVAAMALDCTVVAAFTVAGRAHVVAEVEVARGSRFAGASVGDVERATHLRVLGRSTADGAGESPLAAAATLAAGDRLVVDGSVEQVESVLRGFSRPTSDRS